VIADHTDHAERRIERSKSRHPAQDLLLLARRALGFRRVPADIIAQQQHQIRPQAVHALNNATHARGIDMGACHMRVAERGNRQRRAMPIRAHDLDSAHDQQVRLDEPSIDVQPVSRFE